MQQFDKDKLSELAKKAQKKLWEEHKHNFQKMTKNRRKQISEAVGYKTLQLGVGIHAINADPKKAKENAQRAGLVAKEKSAGFLNIESNKHGSKAVKGTVWWVNSETKERKRSKVCPGKLWKRGMT
jgi:hypothetical protein